MSLKLEWNAWMEGHSDRKWFLITIIDCVQSNSRLNWSRFAHRTHLQKTNTIITVRSIPTYATHRSISCRLSITRITEFPNPTVLRTSYAFLCACLRRSRWTAYCANTATPVAKASSNIREEFFADSNARFSSSCTCKESYTNPLIHTLCIDRIYWVLQKSHWRIRATSRIKSSKVTKIGEEPPNGSHQGQC